MSQTRALELNLASRPFRNNMLLWIGHTFLVAGVIAFTAWNTTTFLETGRKLQALRSNVGSIESRVSDVDVRERRAQAEIGKHDLKYLATQTVKANDVILRKALSWTRLFNLLEGVQPYEVKMVSIRPVFGTANAARAPLLAAKGPDEVVPVSVEGTARDLSAFLDFERALIADPHFDRVEPERSNHSKNGELIFGLSFLYYPEGQMDKTDAPPPVARAPRPKGAAAEAAEDEEVEEPSAGAVDEAEEAHVEDAWNPPPPSVPAPTAQIAKPEAKPGKAPPEAAPSATAPDANPAALPKYRMPAKEAPVAPLRKRPEGWQPPATPPPPKDDPPDGSGSR